MTSWGSYPKRCEDCSHEYESHRVHCPNCGSRITAIVFPDDHYMSKCAIGDKRERPKGVRIWGGHRWLCIHNRQPGKCVECGGSQICVHGKREYRFKDCRSWQCHHGKVRADCKYCRKNTIENSLRARIGMAISSAKATKSSNTEELLGCSIERARLHLESQFVDGMSWGNHGEWHIDHRRPCSSFDLKNSEEQRMCFHHTNLQPLWSSENLSKGSHFNEDLFPWEWNGSMWVEKK